MTVRILIAEPMDFSPAAADILRRAGEVELRDCHTLGLKNAVRDFDVVWLRLGHRISEATLASAERCRIIATPVTGLDHIDLEACERRNIQVLSLKGQTEFLRTVRATAEHTLALTLALMRHLPAAAHAAAHGIWNRDLFRGSELNGRTAGIVGVGRLGTIVASYFAALGMNVIGFDVRPDFPTSVRRVDTLNDLLNQADVVSLHVSLDDTTRRMVGHAQFAAMRNDAVLINTSRGGVVDDRALLAALETGQIAGAALDVVEGEPDIPADHPLAVYARAHANLLLTPHIGGNTWDSFRKTEIFLAERVVSALAVG